MVVYADRSELLAVACVPAWTGGLFDGTLRLVASGGAIRAQPMRHESLHAQLAGVVRGQPRWFDEGLAQVFAEPDRPHWHGALALLTRNRTYIPFSSLAGSFYAFGGNEEADLAYAQSEAMVRWLIAAQGPGAVAEAVRYFNGGGAPAGLFRALDPAGRLDEAAFLGWLRSRRPVR